METSRPIGARIRKTSWTVALFLFLCSILVLSPRSANSFPLSGDQVVLPPGTELNKESLDRPREIYRSQAIGGATVLTTELMLTIDPPSGPKCLTASCDAKSSPSTFRSNILWKCSGVTSASGANW